MVLTTQKEKPLIKGFIIKIEIVLALYDFCGTIIFEKERTKWEN